MDMSPALDQGYARHSAFPSAEAAFEQLHALELAGLDGRALLREAIRSVLPGQLASVSSFGAESALLLSLIAEIDPSVPVIFLETGKHFPETLAYREELAAHLGLTDVRDVAPRAEALADGDPTGELWYFDPDACCALRKVRPLDAALSGFAGWISGRKRFQAASRNTLPLVELETLKSGERRVKLNPLADWDAARLKTEMQARDLPAHPLVERGYPSIGCSVCTRAVGAGEDARAGRWSGSGKVECGIHRVTA